MAVEEAVMPTVLEASAQTRPVTALAEIRRLLVQVEPGAEAAPRLEVAVDLARRLDADLLGVGVETIQGIGIGDPFMDGDWIADLEALRQENLKRAEANFRGQTDGVRTEWLALKATPELALAQLSRGVDLIVAGGAPLDRAAQSADTAELVIRCGRPVLVAPPRGGGLRGEAVVVGWKDTRESRRAVADAMPFLKAAEAVSVVEVCGEDAYAEAELHTFEVAKHLRRHGVTAEAKAIIAPAERVATELNIVAQAIGADLIVAGAYGHTRLGEWLFGGVTHSLIHEPERFALLSH
jgi:nucleotide-binding universal stress UspA family protein